ncbi:MAG: hypothetical protein PHO01_04485 [Desulfotomaculaceae bacterium]|nr:hypothetical protein [Desulfotomaculaceae bacterium]
MSNKTVNYKEIYRITSAITPIQSDCGELCGKVCCQPDSEDDLGVYLFPGEECMFTGKEKWLQWERRHPDEDDFPPSWEYPVYFVRCTGLCPRKQRPLNCRFFPLAPHLLKDDTLFLIHETLELPYLCPLIARRIPLRKDFMEVTALCWQRLLADPRIRDLVEMDSREREREGCRPNIIYPVSRYFRQNQRHNSCTNKWANRYTFEKSDPNDRAD